MRACTLWTGLLLLTAVVACKTVVPTKPKVALPPMPQNVPVPTKARAARSVSSSVSTNRTSSANLPLLLTPGVQFTTISNAGTSIFLSWTGQSNPVAVQASADLKHWTNASAPVPQNSLSLTNYASRLNYRLRQATNQVQINKLFFDSYYVSTNAQGYSGIITHDFDRCYLDLYGRDRSRKHYWISDLLTTDLNYGCGYAWTPDGHIVISYVPSNTNRVFVTEFEFNGTNIDRVSEIVTGDAQSLTPDVLKLSDGTIVIASPGQCPGMEAWMLHRTPQGIWKDDGKIQIIPCGGGGEPAGYLKLAEIPWNHHPMIAGVHDGSGILRVMEWQYFGINSVFQMVTNFTFITHEFICPAQHPPAPPPPCYFAYGEMTVHGEIPPLQVIGDPSSNRVIFVYGNEDREGIFGTIGAGDLSCTKVAVTAMLPNYSTNFLFTCPGLVERVAEAQTIAMSNGVPIVTYIPLTATYATNWPVLSVATRVINGQEVSQEMYCLGWNYIFSHRNTRDLVGVRDDRTVTVILNP